MDVTTETVATREIEITIHPEPEQIEEARRKAARKASQRVRIPGFRPGKAPYALVERTVGKEYLTEEAAEDLAPSLYQQALEQGGYEPFARPTLRVTQQEPLELKIRVPLQPVVQLPDYCAIEIEPEPPVEITAEQEERLLNEVREQHGTWLPVERPVQVGDQVTLDIRGVSDGETVTDEEGTEVILAETLSPPGLAAEIAGMEPGQTREFTLTYPEDFAQRSLAGKAVEFTATVREVKERQLPELDDEFAKSVGDYATLDDLKTRLREGLQAQLDNESRNRFATRVLDEVVQRSSLEYPNIAVEEEIDDLVRQRENRLRQQGFTLENYLRVIHKSPAQLRDELRAEAEETLRRALVLREVGKAEQVEVKPEEVMAEIGRVAQAYGEQAEAVRQAFTQEGALRSLWNDMYLRQSLMRLVDVVTGEAEGACAAPEAEAPAAAAEAQVEPEVQAPAAEAAEAQAEAEAEVPGEPAADETPGV